LNFKLFFSTERAVAPWLLTKNEPNFAELVQFNKFDVSATCLSSGFAGITCTCRFNYASSHVEWVLKVHCATPVQVCMDHGTLHG